MQRKKLWIPQNLCLNYRTCVRRDGTFCHYRQFIQGLGGVPGVFQLNDEGIHNACLYV
jgi:hypothetical protein